MSKNCINCIEAQRNGPDLLCNDCRYERSILQVKHCAAVALQALETIRTEHMAAHGLPNEATAVSTARVELMKIWPEISTSEISNSTSPEALEALLKRAAIASATLTQ